MNKFKNISFFELITIFYIIILLISIFLKIEWTNVQLTIVVIILINLGINSIKEKTKENNNK